MTEYSVHNEPDFARVYDDDEQVLVRRGDLQALLNLATGSMDFGSGFWDHELWARVGLPAGPEQGGHSDG
jgi:hypothetical protein